MRMMVSDQVSEMTPRCTISLTCSEKTWLDDDFGYLVFRVHSAVTHSISHRVLAELNVTAAQGRLLHLVSRRGQWHATQISRECGVDLAAVTRLIDRLVRAGLLVRTRSTVDRRVNCLVLTERGQNVADQVPVILADVHRTLLAGFSADEVTSFKQMLLRMP
jgi:DNA-binding MarR family transcriptional regulator